MDICKYFTLKWQNISFLPLKIQIDPLGVGTEPRYQINNNYDRVITAFILY